MKLCRTRNTTGGFTLLEVIVAMTIVGLGIVTLMEIFSQGLRLGARSTVRTEVITDGRQLMDEFLARRKLPEGTERGTLAEKGRWTLLVQATKSSPTELSLSNPWELKEVALDVRVSDAGRERHVEFNTLRLIKKSNP
jgi:prepilin-type N-terminal cleavage/methylation domain-containing protein